MTQHHEDPHGEGIARVMQAAAMTATLVEALARARTQRLSDRAEADWNATAATRATSLTAHAAAHLTATRAHGSAPAVQAAPRSVDDGVVPVTTPVLQPLTRAPRVVAGEAYPSPVQPSPPAVSSAFTRQVTARPALGRGPR